MTAAPRADDLIDAAARGWRAWVVLAFLAVAAALPGLFSIPPLDRDESRFAQATAQMLETGDFTHIRLQDEDRYKKPIGIYWLQAASVAAFSDVEKREIWAWRLPSMLGAVIAVWATFWGGLVLVGRRAAFVGAALFAVSVLMSTEAMIAKTDAMLCAMTALSMAALGRVHMGVGGRRTMLLFWAALALGVLIKGPITPMVVGLSAGALCLWRRDIARLRPLISISGPALALVLLAPWLYTLAESESSLTGMMRDIAPKIGGGGEHGNRPPGLHLLLLPLLIFPVSIGLAPAFADGWRALRAPRDDADHAGARFLVAWIVPTWLVFELATTKLAHYTLPLYPAIALLSGAGLLRWLESPKSSRRIGLAAGYFVGSIGIIAAASMLTYWRSDAPAYDSALIVGGAFLGGSLILSAVMAHNNRAGALTATAILGALVLLIATREVLAPRATHVLVSQAAAALTDSDAAPLLVIGYREPSIVFAEGTDTVLRQGAEGGAAAVAGQTALVEARERAAFEAALSARGLKFEPEDTPLAGRDYSNGDDVVLQAGRVTAARN
jgi:4-amino-4-deoxy-L-arabinose transferase-like glycosyltransferase